MKQMVRLLFCSIAMISSSYAMESSHVQDESTQSTGLNGTQFSPVKAIVAQKRSPIKSPKNKTTSNVIKRSISYNKWKEEADTLNMNFNKVNDILSEQRKSRSKRIKLGFGLIYGASNVADIILENIQADFNAQPHNDGFKQGEMMTAYEYELLRNQIESDRYAFLKTPPTSPRKKPKTS